MIAEASVIAILKSTTALAGSAWGVLVVEGDWTIAVIALIPLVLCGWMTLHYSRRLRGKRAEGGP